MGWVGVWPRLGCLERWAPVVYGVDQYRKRAAGWIMERERVMKADPTRRFRNRGVRLKMIWRRKRGTPQLSRNWALVCLESRRHRGWAQQAHSAEEDWRPPCLQGPPCLTTSWQLGFFIMPLFRTDVILTSKRSSYLFRGTREPHFHSEHNFHLV